MRFQSLALLPGGLVLALSLAHGEVAVDASQPAAPPQPLPFAAGGRTPDGRTLAINSRYLLRDGQPWLPVMGEFHYSRYPASDWEREILKMKAGGVSIISTYVFWIHHEEVEGKFEWSGQRDLRRFVELAGKRGMLVWVRVGPWDHGEARNGGLPDWLLRKAPTRENDPVYLKYVARFYAQIGGQLKGLFWKDGGPIIGVQIENEYHERGAGKGEAHILALKKLALDAGLDAPFYSITGWDDAVLPAGGVVPVFSGYPDGFWQRSLVPLAPSPDYFFTPFRCDENVTADLTSARPDLDARFASYPFLTAEMAGGMEFSYHRRPLMTADDVAALEVVKLGSGAVLYGYYMFHGGANPDGRDSTLEESQATGYPNDLPVKTYDFQAPLGEFGQMHASFRDLKTLHQFLSDFGPALAPMKAYFPEKMPAGKSDLETPRVAVRSDSRRGFIFLNNYQKDHPLPERRGFQVRLSLAPGVLDVPRLPVDIPSGAYTFWPVNLPLGAATLEYATAQPLCRLDDPDVTVFFAWPGIAPEFAFVDAEGLSIEAPAATVRRGNGRVYIGGMTPGPGVAIRLRNKDGRTTDVVILARDQARNLWKAPLAGRERLVLSPADVYFEGDRIHLSAADPAWLNFGVFPGVDGNVPGFRHAGREGIFERYATSVEPVHAAAAVRQLAGAGRVGPVKMGQEVPVAPTEAAFKAAARWSIGVTDPAPDAVGDVFLRITYQGDVARLYAGGHLITDDFYHGTPWEIGLRNIPAAERKQLQIDILPLRQDAPIYLPAGIRPATYQDGQAAKLVGVEVIVDYRASADLSAASMVSAHSAQDRNGTDKGASR